MVRVPTSRCCSRAAAIFGIFQGGEHAAGMHQHIFTGGGSGALAASALEQRQPTAPQLLDLHGRGGGEVQQASAARAS